MIKEIENFKYIVDKQDEIIGVITSSKSKPLQLILKDKSKKVILKNLK